MTHIPAKPQLYDGIDEEPVLNGTQCTQCSASFFPPLSIGCEICGAPAAELTGQRMKATGVLHSLATVHHHASDDIRTPFTVAEVQLDAGPLVRALMSRTTDTAWIGHRVHAVWERIGVDESGQPVVEPRFALDEVSHGGDT